MSDHAISPPSAKTTVGGLAAMLYGIVAYLLFLATILYAIAFVGNLPCGHHRVVQDHVVRQVAIFNQREHE